MKQAFTIERLRWQPGTYRNSPRIAHWVVSGVWRAKSTADALQRAQRATGAALSELRVSGIRFANKTRP